MAAAFEFKVRYPKRSINIDGVREFIKATVDKEADYADGLFDESHKAWSSESTPARIDDARSDGDNYIRTIGRSGMIYHIVSKGRDPKASWVRYGYIPQKSAPSTIPGSLKSVPRYESGPWLKVSEEHAFQHPGIRAREFDLQIVDLSRKRISTSLNVRSLVRLIWK